jgi:predicted dienelactone hydrolase
MARLWACAAMACALGAGAAFATPSSTRSHGQAVHFRRFRFVDRSRTIRLPDGTRLPRSLETVVRYPATGGPYPLIVFAHGYALTPETYSRLLGAWARAGYVVAAPAFPLERAGARGGPDQSDLVNEPRDVSFVIGRLLALGALAGRIDPARIAVAGHSDGAVVALAVAFDRRSETGARARRSSSPERRSPEWGRSRMAGRRSSQSRALPTQSTRQRRRQHSSAAHGGRSSCSGCSARRTSRPTRRRSRSSASWNA